MIIAIFSLSYSCKLVSQTAKNSSDLTFGYVANPLVFNNCNLWNDHCDTSVLTPSCTNKQNLISQVISKQLKMVPTRLLVMLTLDTWHLTYKQAKSRFHIRLISKQLEMVPTWLSVILLGICCFPVFRYWNLWNDHCDIFTDIFLSKTLVPYLIPAQLIFKKPKLGSDLTIGYVARNLLLPLFSVIAPPVEKGSTNNWAHRWVGSWSAGLSSSSPESSSW